MMTPTRSARRPLALTALICCALFAGSASAETPPAKDKPAAKDKGMQMSPMQFDKYYMVFLRRGPAWTAEKSPELERLHQEHLAHLRRLAEEGKMVAAGPFDEQQDESLAGMCLFKVESREEALKLAEQDPAVKAGRFKLEATAWYTLKGVLAFPLTKPAK